MSLLHFAYPLLACAGYLAWPKLVRGTLSAPVHRAVSVVHNLALVVFSAYTFWGILKLVLVHGFVFKSKYFFGMPEFDTLAWYFYLSKYYEFIDTFLIYAKGKKPIFLQTYHHVGGRAMLAYVVRIQNRWCVAAYVYERVCAYGHVHVLLVHHFQTQRVRRQAVYYRDANGPVLDWWNRRADLVRAAE